MRAATIAIVSVIVIGFVAFGANAAAGQLLPFLGMGSSSGADAGQFPSSEASTPKTEWTAGTAPYLYQTDQQWASVEYASNRFSESGCGPTCLSMVYVMLTGRSDRTPADMAAFSTQNGFASEEGTSWLFMSAGAEELGLRVEQIPLDEESIRRQLAAGHPVICSMTAGDFTTSGHFIVLTDIDANGKVVIRDPNSAERSKKSWDFDTITSQCVNLWAYSV